MSDERASADGQLKGKLVRGAVVNFLGVVAKAAGVPLQFIILTRLYGRAPIGLFFVAYAVVQLATALATWGFVDATLLFASRHIDEEGGLDRLFSYLRRLIFYLVTSGWALAGLLFWSAPLIGATFYPHYEGFVPVLRALALFAPLNALTQATVTVAKARLLMGHDAVVNGIVVPFSITLFGVLFYFVGPREVGVSLAYCAGFMVGLLVAVVLLSKMLPLGAIVRGRFTPKPTPGIIGFAVPQGLNMALSQFISSMDVLMLAYFNVLESEVAFYALGAQIVYNVSQIKRVFSGTYAPVIARHYYEKRHDQLNATFSMVTGWTISLAVPVLFIVAFFRQELLILFNPGFTEPADFMLLLLFNPLVACAIGLMGNAVVMAGFSRWNLLNSLVGAVLNFVLNALLIPEMGVWGAALGSVIAMSVMSLMYAIEAKRLIGIRLPWAAILPWLGVGAALFLPPMFLLPIDLHIGLKLGVAAPLLGGYAVLWRRHRKKTASTEMS